MARRNELKELVLPCTAMVAVQCSTVVGNILVKAASSKEMNYFVFTAYCYPLGFFVFLLLASFFKRKTAFPPSKFPLFSRILVFELLGFPGVESRIRVSFIVIDRDSPPKSTPTDFYRLWWQSQIMKIYPEEITVTFFGKLFGTIISLPVCLLVEPNLSSWRLSSSLAVVAVLYMGLFGISFSSLMYMWAIHLKGPVFVASFQPTSIVIAVVMSAIFLGEAIFLGRY
ncbi:hypothetical protein V6N12_047436 [Hibiscus sabdariffa]|uniref:WAT1-related protein n=1 Tax=Hibiscus sabdariffa TaxID=183260 RepID=A0ABR2DAV6_9ROSI